MSSEGNSGERLGRDLNSKINEIERRVEEMMRALYGYPAMGQTGFRQDVERRVEELNREINTVRDLCESLQDERRDELAERRGMRRLIGYTGVSSLLTLLTLVGTIIAIFNGMGTGA